MKTATVTFVGTSPYSQGRYIATEKKSGETNDAFEERTWRERMPLDPTTGAVMLSPMAIKRGLEDAAAFTGRKIKGQGNKTYTAKFKSCVMVTTPIQLCPAGTEILGEWLFVPSDGKRGGPKRVMKCFPYLTEWGGTAEIAVLDDTITEDVLMDMITTMGRFIGLGRFRPQNGGYYGRFDIEDLDWR